MSIGTLTISSPCVACSYQLRAVGGVLAGGGDPTNMLAWINAYDLDTVAWGALQTGNFSSPSQTTPPSQSGGSIYGALTGSQNQLHNLNPGQSPPCTLLANNPPIAYRAQALLPLPTAYYVIAWGLAMDATLSAECGTDLFIAQGCVYPRQADNMYPMVVDLDIPDDSLDASVLVQNYYLGIIVPGSGAYNSINGPVFSIQQDLAGMTPASAHMNAPFGPNWDSTAVCHASPDPSTADPFIG